MNPEKPYFTVITPTYNRAKYILTAIESVLAQTFQEFELIIVDDGSEDETASLVATFSSADPRVRYIKQENKGRSVARNVGIEAAHGEYVSFLDSDDYWQPTHLQNIFDFLQSLKQPAFVFTGLAYQYPNKVVEKRFPPVGNTMPIDYVIGNQVSTITVAIHHSALQKHQFNPLLAINEDLELWSRIVSEFPLHYIDEVTAVAIQHEANTQTLSVEFIDSQKRAMDLVFSNELLTPYYSQRFMKRKLRGLLELRIRSAEAQNHKGKLISAILKYLLKYPAAPRNKSKLVLLLYAMPGGSILKRLIQG